LSYWYGLSYSQIAQMPVPAINAYLEKLQARIAETKLMMADAASVPHMKLSDRKTTLNNWMRTVNIHSPTKSKPASKARLKMMGIGVRYVKPG
jgi:hypothetical protein